MTGARPGVVARSLSKHYGEGNTYVQALKEAGFEIQPGEVVALLGPSGSGKSTLLTILGLINPPNSGWLEIGGQEVIRDGQMVGDANLIRRRELGFVFQRSNLIPFLTAAENVRLVLELDDVPRREAKRRTHDVMEALGVVDRAGHLPAQLSGGQQQRVAIARSLIHQPSLLLADEPTASLDKEMGRQVMRLFRSAAKERGAAVLVVTHDQRSLDLVDRIFEIEDGVLGIGSEGAATCSTPDAG
ncbi:MAG: ABC transporter ATP-binding protein [Deltaproteobacteria bacterium]|nr:ABC transporter ATP-binding protein [Deltaproteobacteria bacterium]